MNAPRRIPRGCSPIYVEQVTDCAICGDVAQSWDLCEVDSLRTAARLECRVGDTVCLDCARPARRRRREGGAR